MCYQQIHCFFRYQFKLLPYCTDRDDYFHRGGGIIKAYDMVVVGKPAMLFENNVKQICGVCIIGYKNILALVGVFFLKLCQDIFKLLL